jgi:hypothetical protein
MAKRRNNIGTQRKTLGVIVPAASLLLGIAGAASTAEAADGTFDDGRRWKLDSTYENATFLRDDVGLSKFRNTFQFEGMAELGQLGFFSDVKLNGTLRGTWDGVYRLNSGEFGDDAGGPVQFENGAAGVDYSPVFGAPPGTLVGGGTVPQGGGIGLFNSGGVLANNPNEGMEVLGGNGGLAFGVPQRPCNVDRRGCRDFGGYGDLTENELEFPEFNDRLDFIRELNLSGKVNFDAGQQLFIRLGKQQVVWGRTDLFRVLDVVNPVDYSRQNIYDELEDIRIPMWMLQAEYRMGATELFEDLNFQLVWNFDQFRPNNLGQGGSPYSILQAGDLFRGLANIWDNGGTVANFAGSGALGGVHGMATVFGPNQIGIRDVHLPDWSLENTQIGGKIEGSIEGVGFSLNYLNYRSQLPSLRGGIPSVNPFTGVVDVYDYVPAFDVYYPRVQLFGGSADIQVEEIESVFRFEVAYTTGEEFANTARPELFSESDVVRYVIGWDRPTFIPFLNETRAFTVSAQLFGQHLLDHELYNGAYGKVGMPEWEDNWIGTLLIKGFYMSDTLSPQIIFAHDFRGDASAIAPSVSWLVTDNLQLSLGANIKFGPGQQSFDDDSSSNPFPGFTGPPGAAMPSNGLAGYEPLGRFRSGPIGMALDEDELQFTLKYRF